jgi:hypothetical protein
MDVVITYVNGLDPVWKKDFQQYTNRPIIEKRFRDWGTLKYLVRGIETYMPFIRNVYLVVSGESQIPDWANTSHLKIVLHKDIIPSEYLPTFNCNTIEMYLPKIEGLDEEFIYFNDDIFPLNYCKPEDFFRDNKIILKFSHHILIHNMFKKICRNSDVLSRKLLGKKPSTCFIRPQHVCTPMYKSECEEVLRLAEKEIKESIGMLRSENDYGQYLFLDYLYYKGKAISRRLSKKHFSVALLSTSTIRKFILHPTRKLVCINDVRLSAKRYEKLRQVIIKAFESRLPSPSRFEK